MTPVFEVPLTVGVNVVLWPPLSDALAGDKLMLTGVAAGCSVRETVAMSVGSAALMAVRTTVCVDVILAGAVYSPLNTVPTFGVSDHSTPEYAAPCTVALNCVDWPAVRVVAPCAIEMLIFAGAGVGAGVGIVTGWPISAVAVDVTLVSAILVAQIVTCVSPPTDGGAVYKPLTMLPTAGLTDHCTCWLDVP